MKSKERIKNLLFIKSKEGKLSYHPAGVFGPSYILENTDQKEKLGKFAFSLYVAHVLVTALIMLSVYKFGDYICPYLHGKDRFIMVWPFLIIYFAVLNFWLNSRFSNLQRYPYFKGYVIMLEHASEQRLTSTKIMIGFVLSAIALVACLILDASQILGEEGRYYILFIVVPLLVFALLNRFYLILNKYRREP